MKHARIETDYGAIEVELYDADAPKTVANFLALAERHFYDNLVFHRVISDFMIQGGCPEGTGRGGPGYNVVDEFDGNPHTHLTGSLSMANKGAPNSGGSQFFICHRPLEHLNGKHTVFGRVIRGIDLIYRVKAGDKLLRIAEFRP